MRPTPLSLALAASSAALLLAPPAEAASPGANGVLAVSYDEFGRGGEQFYGIKLIRPGGTLERTFAKCENNEFDPALAPCPYEPAFSPDGSRVAYRIDDQLAVADVDGTDLRLLAQVTARDSQPAWSPDGDSLVFTGRPGPIGTATNLYLVGADGTAPRRLTLRGGHSPAWSSRGTIAYVRRGSIYRLSPRTGRQSRLTRGESPDFSPSGRTIVYSLRRGQRADVYRVGMTGEPRRLLVRNAQEPAYSPDSRRLAFVRVKRTLSITSVHIAGSDGTKQRVLRQGFERPIGSQFVDWYDVAWQPLP